MKSQIAINKKKLAAEINKSYSTMEAAKKNYVFSVIYLGEKLLEARDSVGFGEWEEFVNRNSEFRFGARQARKYMHVAQHKELVITIFGNPDLRPSINQIAKAISAPKPAPAATAPVEAGDDEIIDMLMVDPLPTLGQGSKNTTDAEFAPVSPQAIGTPTPSVDPEPVKPGNNEDEEDWYDIDHGDWDTETDDDRPEDVPAELEALRRRIAWMESIFDDDNHTAAAIREIEKLKTINDGLQNRLDALVAENGQLQGRLNYWESRAKKLEKSNDK